MFTAKKSSLFKIKVKETVNKTSAISGKYGDLFLKENENPFLNFGYAKSSEKLDDDEFSFKKELSKTLSGNNAIKYSSSGNMPISEFVDQYASISRYLSPRPFADIARDMDVLWSINQELTIKFTLYLRTITRTTSLFDGTKTKTSQRGAGLKHESIVRMIWLAVNTPEHFANHIGLFITVGSWKDIFKMLSYDLQYNAWEDKVLNWDFMGKIILSGLENPNTTNLVRKYLPQIKIRDKCTTLESQANNIIGKWVCKLVFGDSDGNGKTYKMYRELKRSGDAHVWQQLISQGKHKLVDFDTVHGRALSIMVSGNYLKNQGLIEKYEEWIISKPVAKFTGFPHELIGNIKKANNIPYLKHTINAQFNNLVEEAKKGLVGSNIRPISVLDTSGSMTCNMYIGNGEVGKYQSIEVAFSSALFFNEMMDKESPFYDYFLEFSSKAILNKFKGDNFVEKYNNNHMNSYGSTNIASVFDFFVEFKTKNPHVSEDLIPNFAVCFSDGEFDNNGVDISNVESGRNKLRRVYSKGFCDNFGICFVDLPNNFYNNRPLTKFETFNDSKNVFYFSGYDLSPLSFLFGVEGGRLENGIPQSAEELFLASMNQEILNMVNI